MPKRKNAPQIERVAAAKMVQAIQVAAQLRLKGKLHVALGCIYLQSGDDLHISLGQPFLDYSPYQKVLSSKDVYGEVVLGYMAQGRVQPYPTEKQRKNMNPHQLLKTEHVAACVHTNWIYAHMCLQPIKGALSSPKFSHAVGLVERAADTLFAVSFKIHQAALDLSQMLGIIERVLAADLAADFWR